MLRYQWLIENIDIEELVDEFITFYLAGIVHGYLDIVQVR